MTLNEQRIRIDRKVYGASMELRTRPWSKQSKLSRAHLDMIERLANEDGWYWNEYVAEWTRSTSGRDNGNKWHVGERLNTRAVVRIYSSEARELIGEGK